MTILGSRAAAADPPVFDGRLLLGVRTMPFDPDDDRHIVHSSSVAASALVGLRFTRVVIGVHAGVASSLNDSYQEDCCYSAETYPQGTTRVRAIDLGVGAALDIAAGAWISGWVGMTRSSFDSDSPAQFVNNISFYGQIPESSLSGSATRFGFGVALGYDVLRTQYGRGGVFFAIERQNFGPFANRSETAGVVLEREDATAFAYDLGVTYAY